MVASRVGLVTIAVDPPKRLNAVEVVDAYAVVLGQKVFEHSTGGFKELMGFAGGLASSSVGGRGCDRGR